jgi:glycosyltransferase involved in cell wall biosynthesis
MRLDERPTTDYRLRTTDMIRIGYDTTSLIGSYTGVGTYTRQLLNHMIAHDDAHDFLLLSNRPELINDIPYSTRVNPLGRSFPSRMLWMQVVLPKLLHEARPDLCHYTNSIGPLYSPCRYVVTIHDMTLSLLPQYHPRRKHLLVRPFIPLIARRAARIITVSEQARSDIVRLLRVPEERVVVIPEAAAPIYRVVSDDERRRVCTRYGLHKPYLLYVGTLEPRKNLVRLIRAWRRLRRQGVIPHQLVLAGGRGWRDAEIYRTVKALECGDDLLMPGYVPLEDLPALYGAADGFAFPSLSEGFGLPVIEAMACGTPVLTSATLALRELACDAALTVDPHDEHAIAEGLARLLLDESLRCELRARGLRRAAEYSWAEAARRTLALYDEVAV